MKILWPISIVTFTITGSLTEFFLWVIKIQGFMQLGSVFEKRCYRINSKKAYKVFVYRLKDVLQLLITETVYIS